VCVCFTESVCPHEMVCGCVLPKVPQTSARVLGTEGKRGMSEGARETQTDTRPPGRRAANEFCDG